MSETAAPVARSVIKMYGTPGSPRYSVSVVQGTSAAELDELVDLALDAFETLHTRHADRRRRAAEAEPKGAPFA